MHSDNLIDRIFSILSSPNEFLQDIQIDLSSFFPTLLPKNFNLYGTLAHPTDKITNK